MKERRSTVRVPFVGRAHYCPSADLLPRDGWIANISGSGVSLYTQENHSPRERITVSFVPEGENDPITATGIVEWSSEDQVDGKWHPTGISWLPIEETSQERFDEFLEELKADTDEDVDETVAAAPPADPPSPLKQAAIRIGLGMSVMAVLVGVIGVYSIMTENRQLASDLQARDAVISQMESQNRTLKDELNQTRAHLLETSGAITELESQGRYFQQEIFRLSDGLERFQEAYAKSREENEILSRKLELMNDVQWELFSDRSRLMVKNQELQSQMTSIPSLRRALSSAIAAETAKAYEREETGREGSRRRTVVEVKDPRFVER